MIGKIMVYDRRLRGGDPWAVRMKEGSWKEILLWAKTKKNKVGDRIEITIKDYKYFSSAVVDIKKMEVIKEEPTFFHLAFFVFDKEKYIISVHFSFKRALKILEYLEKKVGDCFDIDVAHTLDIET